MATAEQMPTGPRAAEVVTSPLVERIRRGVIGEGELMEGPFGPRRVTYADYTASGRSLDFICTARHGLRPRRPDGLPRRRGHAGEEAFPGYLREARAILAARPAHPDDGPTGLPPEFEALRWFPLPPPASRDGRPARLRPADVPLPPPRRPSVRSGLPFGLTARRAVRDREESCSPRPTAPIQPRDAGKPHRAAPHAGTMG